MAKEERVNRKANPEHADSIMENLNRLDMLNKLREQSESEAVNRENEAKLKLYEIAKMADKNERKSIEIKAENIIYNEGSVVGDLTQSSSHKTVKTAAKTDTNMIKKITVGISIGVIVGLILFYLFGIGG